LRPSRRPIVIATRRSRLAQAQANAVARALRKLHPGVEVRMLLVDTDGDKVLDRGMGPAGGKGLFTRAIELALLHERADLAVHSLKDLPTDAQAGLVIAAIPPRGDVRDCLIAHSAESIEKLPQGAKVGTASLRRAAQVKHVRPDLRVEPLHGNIDTRLRRVLEERAFDMTLLAAAGLQRAGLGQHANRPLPTEVMLPAAGQAALALQCRADDHVTLRRCMALNDSQTALCVEAERGVAAALAADCHAPLAALAEAVDGRQIRLRARAMNPGGSVCLEADRTGTLKSIKRITQAVIDELVDQGARQVMAGAGG
jgi:hydroxymethylbilane synthase